MNLRVEVAVGCGLDCPADACTSVCPVTCDEIASKASSSELWMCFIFATIASKYAQPTTNNSMTGDKDLCDDLREKNLVEGNALGPRMFRPMKLRRELQSQTLYFNQECTRCLVNRLSEECCNPNLRCCRSYRVRLSSQSVKSSH